ncbi:helix-turn-helix domain-containing protein [Bartonella sp. DGB1]|uniref:helix-turn-helix domain-containing protein n=1 Tax=Bartonella sp. DGB1 TaxID=3239807 RepID=UPI0035260D32
MAGTIVIIIEKNPQYNYRFSSYLKRIGYQVITFNTINDSLEFLTSGITNQNIIVILGETAIENSLEEALKILSNSLPELYFLILSLTKVPDDISLKLKIDEIILYDDNLLRLKISINRLLMYNKSLINKEKAFSLDKCVYFSDFYEGEEVVDPILPQLKKVSDHNSNLLLEGESGTGKRFCANIIHCESSRADKKFTILSAKSFNNIEIILEEAKKNWENNEFTNVLSEALEKTKGGSLYVSDLDELTLLHLRYFIFVIERLHKIFDFRLITSSKKKLKNKFKNSPYISIIIAYLASDYIYFLPLRQKRKEIIGLSNFILNKITQQTEFLHITHINDNILQLLQYEEWEKNVKQLYQAILRAVLITKDSILGIDDFPDLFVDHSYIMNYVNPENNTSNISIFYPKSRKIRTLAEIEQSILAAVLKEKNNSISATAKSLNISRSTIYRKLSFYNMLPLGKGFANS